MAFRIYYADGTSSDQRPEALERKYGVICILQQRADGYYHMVSNAPYYLLVKGSWLPAFENDVIDYLVNQAGAVEACIVGRIVDKGTFRKIYEQAQSDRQKMD